MYVHAGHGRPNRNTFRPECANHKRNVNHSARRRGHHESATALALCTHVRYALAAERMPAQQLISSYNVRICTHMRLQRMPARLISCYTVERNSGVAYATRRARLHAQASPRLYSSAYQSSSSSFYPVLVALLVDELFIHDRLHLQHLGLTTGRRAVRAGLLLRRRQPPL